MSGEGCFAPRAGGAPPAARGASGDRGRSHLGRTACVRGRSSYARVPCAYSWRHVLSSGPGTCRAAPPRAPATPPGGRERKSRVEPTLSEDYPSGKVSEPISPTQRSIPEGVPTPSSSRALYIYWVGLKPSATVYKRIHLKKKTWDPPSLNININITPAHRRPPRVVVQATD